MPAEVPYRGLGRRGRWRGYPGEQDQDVVRRLERRQPTPGHPRSGRELPSVEPNCRLRIDRVQMEMVKAWCREHWQRSFLKLLESLPCATRSHLVSGDYAAGLADRGRDVLRLEHLDRIEHPELEAERAKFHVFTLGCLAPDSLDGRLVIFFADRQPAHGGIHAEALE